MIENIAFGRITINDHTYNSDLIIYPDGRIEDNWWRKSGHRLAETDIIKLIQSQPDVIVVGAGMYSGMKPAKALEKKLSDMGVRFIVRDNKEAMSIFNKLAPSDKAGACFHLTC